MNSACPPDLSDTGASIRRLRPTRADGILLIALIVANVGLFFLLSPPTSVGNSVMISADDEPDNTVSLEKNGIWRVDGPLGESLIEIKNNRARFARSPCPEKICLHAGWLQHVGDFAACLPNRISLRIAGQKYDSLNY